jgi:hypothetical protein
MKTPFAALPLRFRSSRTHLVRSGPVLAAPCIWRFLNGLDQPCVNRNTASPTPSAITPRLTLFNIRS